MKWFDSAYRTKPGENVDRGFFDRRFKHVDDRVHPLEEQKASYDAEIARLKKITVDEVTVLLGDAAAIADGLANLGTILTAHSATEVTVEAAAITLTIDAEDRSKVPAAAYIVAKPVGIGGVSMAGFMTAWNADTGVMTFSATSVAGSGTYSDWIVGLAAPSTSGLEASGVAVDPITGMDAENVQAALEALKARADEAEALAFAGL